MRETNNREQECRDNSQLTHHPTNKSALQPSIVELNYE